MTKLEQETVIRWNQADPDADLYTAHPAQARHWEKQGCAVEVCDHDPRGNPRGWRCKALREAIRFRWVKDGALVKRRRGPGRRFCANNGGSDGGAGQSNSQGRQGNGLCVNRAIDGSENGGKEVMGSERGS